MKNIIEVSINKYSLFQQLVYLTKLIRPHHWVKNSFLFIPIFFAGEFTNFNKLIDIAFGFVAFSFVASSIYIINDYNDIEADRLHPEKKLRPLAAGIISKKFAIITFLFLIISGFTLAFYLDEKFTFILGIYFILNIAYSFGLKNISILDTFLVSVGFVLRVKAGGAVADIYVTEWLIVMIFLLALFMAFGKRRDDILLKLSSGKDMRKAIKGYNLEFLTSAMTMILAISLVAYLMYMMSPATEIKFGTHRLYYTFVFVLGGVLRYLQIIYLEQDSGSPTKILYKDWFIKLCIILWIISFAFLIYFPHFSIFQ